MNLDAAYLLYIANLTAPTTDDPEQSKRDNFGNTSGQGRPGRRGAEGEFVTHLVFGRPFILFISRKIQRFRSPHIQDLGSI